MSSIDRARAWAARDPDPETQAELTALIERAERGDAAASADLDELERRHILAVLDACEGGKTKAAALLGINRTTLWKKLNQYGLE